MFRYITIVLIILKIILCDDDDNDRGDDDTTITTDENILMKVTIPPRFCCIYSHYNKCSYTCANNTGCVDDYGILLSFYNIPLAFKDCSDCKGSNQWPCLIDRVNY